VMALKPGTGAPSRSLLTPTTTTVPALRMASKACPMCSFLTTPMAAEGAETLDLVRAGADGSPHLLAVWPTTPGQSQARRAGTVNGGSRAPDRRQARELVRLGQAPARLT
jgi:hypothetical protein